MTVSVKQITRNKFTRHALSSNN